MGQKFPIKVWTKLDFFVIITAVLIGQLAKVPAA
jgi:hypothetical protein